MQVLLHQLDSLEHLIMNWMSISEVTLYFLGMLIELPHVGVATLKSRLLYIKHYCIKNEKQGCVLPKWKNIHLWKKLPTFQGSHQLSAALCDDQIDAIYKE